MNSTTLTINTAALASLAQDLIAEDLPGVSTIFWNGRVHGIERLHSELVRWARHPEQAGHEGGHLMQARPAETRMDTGVEGGLVVGAMPNIAPLPKTGIKVTEITRVQRELASLAASGDVDIASVCVRAQAVIERLLSGLAVEQLS